MVSVIAKIELALRGQERNCGLPPGPQAINLRRPDIMLAHASFNNGWTIPVKHLALDVSESSTSGCWVFQPFPQKSSSLWCAPTPIFSKKGTLGCKGVGWDFQGARLRGRNTLACTWPWQQQPDPWHPGSHLSSLLDQKLHTLFGHHQYISPIKHYHSHITLFTQPSTVYTYYITTELGKNE